MGPRVPLRLVSGSPKVSQMLSPLGMYKSTAVSLWKVQYLPYLSSMSVVKRDMEQSLPAIVRVGNRTLFSWFLKRCQACFFNTDWWFLGCTVSYHGSIFVQGSVSPSQGLFGVPQFWEESQVSGSPEYLLEGAGPDGTRTQR